MSQKIDEALETIRATILEELKEHEQTVNRIVENLEVDGETYRTLLVREVLEEVYVAASMEVKLADSYEMALIKAKQVLQKKLGRDMRIYLT